MGTGEGPPAGRVNGRKRRRWLDDTDDDDDDEYVAEEEEDEDHAEELSASSASEEAEDSDAEYQEDEEEEEIETPRPKRPVKGANLGRKRKPDPAAARSRRRKYEEDEDYEEEVEEEEEAEEYHDEVDEEEEPLSRPTSIAKYGGRQKYDDEDYQEEVDEGEEVEECQKSEDEDYQEEVDEDEEVEEYYNEQEEVDVEEEVPSRSISMANRCERTRNVEPSLAEQRPHQQLPLAEERPHRQRREEDTDFDPDLYDDEYELEEDIDFDPEVDEDDDYFEDDEEEEMGAARTKKLTVKKPVKRKPASKRRALKKKKKEKNKKHKKGSKVSRRKSSSAVKKSSSALQRRRYREDEDDDFIVEDEDVVNQHPRKKAKTGTGSQPVSVADEETWPNVDSDTSDFEFVTSDDEPDDADTVQPSTVRKRKKAVSLSESSSDAETVQPSTVRKRKKRVSLSESSSDSEFIVSDKELEDSRKTEPPKALPVLPAPLRRISITRHGEDKGKEKEEPGEAGKPICGICLSEEQRTTVEGVLNCCSHFFCFACIMEWSRVESRCPLCKQRFTTITKTSKVDLGLAFRKAVIKVEERDQVYQPTEEEIRRWLDPYENVVCIECNQGGDDSLMLLCDICDSSAHTYCVGLGREVPDGNWYCSGCRLGDEGTSYTRIQRTVAYERQNYRNQHGGSSVGFGTAAPNGTFERSPSITPRPSFQGIDLNLSPREVPGEIHPTESQVSMDSVSSPPGMRATVSGRRQIHRYIRILLSRPRPPNRPNLYPNIVHHNGAVPRAEPDRQNFSSSSEANSSQILPDGVQNQHNSLPFVQSHSNFAPWMSPTN